MTGRVVVITGANRGIGFELTRQLAAAEDTVVLGSRELAKGERAAAVLAGQGIEVLPRRLDVTQQDSLDDLADEIGHQFGRVDALDTNLLGAWRTTLAFLP